MSAPKAATAAAKAATAAQSIKQREAKLAEAHRQLQADKAQLAAEKAERDARIAEAQRAAEAAVLDGIEDRIDQLKRDVIDATRQMNAAADADVLDVAQLFTAFDVAARAQHALAGYRQTAHQLLSDAGRDIWVAADGRGGRTTVRRMKLTTVRTPQFWEDGSPKVDEHGEHVIRETVEQVLDDSGSPEWEEVIVPARPLDADRMPFAEYLDRLTLHRQKLAAIAGAGQLSEAITEAKTRAAQPFTE